MKFKQFLALVAGTDGFIPMPRLQWVIQTNSRPTAREEAIAAKILEEGNPRQNITGHFPWSSEQQLVLQQLWIQPEKEIVEWRDIAIEGAEDLYSTEGTEFGPMPVPNAVKEPGAVRGDFSARVKEALGEDE